MILKGKKCFFFNMYEYIFLPVEIHTSPREKCFLAHSLSVYIFLSHFPFQNMKHYYYVYAEGEKPNAAFTLPLLTDWLFQTSNIDWCLVHFSGRDNRPVNSPKTHAFCFPNELRKNGRRNRMHFFVPVWLKSFVVWIYWVLCCVYVCTFPSSPHILRQRKRVALHKKDVACNIMCEYGRKREKTVPKSLLEIFFTS